MVLLDIVYLSMNMNRSYASVTLIRLQCIYNLWSIHAIFTTIVYGFGMICMELTRTDDVFSRTTMVLFFVQNESSPNELKLFDNFFGKKRPPKLRGRARRATRRAQPTKARLVGQARPSVSWEARPPLQWLLVPIFFIYSKKILQKNSSKSENFYFCTKTTPW